jgi:hypothetical protein
VELFGHDQRNFGAQQVSCVSRIENVSLMPVFLAGYDIARSEELEWSECDRTTVLDDRQLDRIGRTKYGLGRSGVMFSAIRYMAPPSSLSFLPCPRNALPSFSCSAYFLGIITVLFRPIRYLLAIVRWYILCRLIGVLTNLYGNGLYDETAISIRVAMSTKPRGIAVSECRCCDRDNHGDAIASNAWSQMLGSCRSAPP